MTPPPVVVWSPDTEPLVSIEGVDLLWILPYCIAFFLEWPGMDKPNTDSREKSRTFLCGKGRHEGCAVGCNLQLLSQVPLNRTH